MIHNKKQLSIAKKSIETLTESINALSNSNEMLDLLQIQAWKCRIEDLEEEIKEFESLEDAYELEFSKDNLLKTVINLRIASGMTQKQLAEAIDIKEQQIQRYEQDHYRTASFERIVQILQVLSKDIQLKIYLKKAKIVSLFPDMFKQYSDIVRQKGTLMAC